MHSMGNIKLTYCHIFEEMYLKKTHHSSLIKTQTYVSKLKKLLGL